MTRQGRPPNYIPTVPARNDGRLDELLQQQGGPQSPSQLRTGVQGIPNFDDQMGFLNSYLGRPTQAGTLQQAAFSDVRAAEDAERQRAGLAGQTANEFEGLMRGFGETSASLSQYGRDRINFDPERTDLTQFDAQTAESRATLNSSLDNLRTGIDQQTQAAFKGADEARAAARDAKASANEYRENAQAGIESMVASVKGQYEQAARAINAGVRPDGRKMTLAEQTAARQDIMRDFGPALAQTHGQIATQFSGTLASLQQNAAELGQRAGQMRQQAAQIGMAGEETVARAEQSVEAQFMDRSTTRQQISEADISRANETFLAQAQLGPAFEANVQLSSLEAQLGGFPQLAQYRAQSVRSPINMFSTLANLYAAQNAGSEGANTRNMASFV